MSASPAAPASYVEGLRAALAMARAAHDGIRVWLLADRLLRLFEGRDPLSFLQRAEALALQGEAARAQADAFEAYRVDPTLPGLAERLLPTLPPGPQRQRALAHALLMGLEPSPVILSLARQQGYSALVMMRHVEEGLAGAVIETGPETAEPPASLTLTGETGRAYTLPLVWTTPDHVGDSPRHARFAARWPRNEGWLASSWPGGLLVPPALVAPRIAASPPAQFRAEGVLVIVPAYGDWPSLARCLRSAIHNLGPRDRLVVVEDASPDEALCQGLAALAAQGRITLLRNPVNLGFSGSVNRALSLRQPDEDALVLNADATLPPGGLARLRHLAHARPGIGTVTPLSNNGEDTSVPTRLRANPEPDDALLARLDRCARQANGDDLPVLVNGVGFCLYVTAAALAAVGGFSGAFERGYFEDVDFCLRVDAAGMTNHCAAGVYVAHAGSRSFGGEKAGYVRRNKPRLHARHPGYEARLRHALEHDPLAQAAEAMIRRYLAETTPCPVLMAPEDCPLACIMPLARSLEAGFLLRPKAGGWHIHGLEEAFPFSLVLPAGQGLRQAIPWLAHTSCHVFDAPRITSVPPLDELLPRGWQTATPSLDEIAPEPGLPAESHFAIALAEATAADEARLLAMMAERHQGSYVFLDDIDLSGEIRLVSHQAVYFTGAVEPAGLPDVARRAGLSSLVFAHARYARLDPRRAAARACGLRIYDLA